MYVRISELWHYSVHIDMSMVSCHSAVTGAPIITCVVHSSQNWPWEMTRFPVNSEAGEYKVEIPEIKA